MIPDSLKQLLKSTDGQQTAHWESREVVLFNMPWGELAISLQGAQVLHFRPHDDSDWLWVTPTPQALPGAAASRSAGRGLPTSAMPMKALTAMALFMAWRATLRGA